jgi:sarcosine oxidase, subunit gamma
VTADASAPLVRRSPLGATAPGDYALATGPGVDLVERPFGVQVNVRLDPTDAALAALERRLGLRLPTTPNRRGTGPSGLDVIWLAPDEWLLTGPGDGAMPVSDMEFVVRPLGGTVVDVSAHRTTLELRGPGARDVLASGCSVDLRPRIFEVGHAAQTTLARVDVILTRVAGDTFRILVRASFARYLVDWLKDAIGVIEGGTS